MKTRNRLAILILIIGSLQMIGYLSGSRLLRGIGSATGIAPFPKVFCETEGYEGFAATFVIAGTRPDDTPWELRLTPEAYSQIRGPYNRRNVYGAALAFAPRLPETLRQSLLDEAFAPTSQMRRELRIPEDLREIKIIITPRPGETETLFSYSPTAL